MMNEKKNAHQRGLKILGVISVTFFLFAFSLTAFSQDSTPSESKVEHTKIKQENVSLSLDIPLD